MLFFFRQQNEHIIFHKPLPGNPPGSAVLLYLVGGQVYPVPGMHSEKDDSQSMDDNS